MKGLMAWGLLLCACSGSASPTGNATERPPLPALGAISLQIGGPSTTCPVQPGQIYPVGKPAPSDTDPGQSVIDGESGAAISCSVRGTGPYTFSGAFHATSSDKNGDPIIVTFGGGTINADKTTGSVSVSVFTPQLGSTFFSASTPCTVTVINQQVKGGSLWADFSCPSLTSPPSGVCSSGVAPSVSTLVFENCDGS